MEGRRNQTLRSEKKRIPAIFPDYKGKSTGKEERTAPFMDVGKGMR